MNRQRVQARDVAVDGLDSVRGVTLAGAGAAVGAAQIAVPGVPVDGIPVVGVDFEESPLVSPQADVNGGAVGLQDPLVLG